MKKSIVILLLIFPLFLIGQISMMSGNRNLNLKGVIYKKEFSFEAKLHTLGFAIGFNRGTIKSYHTTKYYHFDIGYLKSYKEKKSNLVSTGLNIFNTYSYGKRNYFFQSRLGLGIKKYLTEKESYKGIAIGYSIEGGVNLGILKPYYLYVKTFSADDNPILEQISYSEENEQLFLDENNIYDKGTFFKGFSKIKFVPGIHINAAAHFAFKAYEKPVYAFETGIMIDAFIKRIPIMVETSSFKNNSIFLNVYINVQIGRRWN